MDEMEAEYNNYWETKRFYEELDSWGIDEALSYYDSSSPDGTASSSSPAAKNIVMERNRRRKLNDKLYALRSVVPNITKMDKASIIKDAIDYVQELQEEERRLMTEVTELESAKKEKSNVSDITQADYLVVGERRKKRISRTSLLAPGSPGTPWLEVMELSVSEVGERTLVVSITCNKKNGTLIKMCDLFESLNLNTISANITSVSGSLLHTLLVEADNVDCIQLKEKIATAIAGYHDKP
ncbi:uncharacterized protein A4U43_C05F24090 [Asparagus officinalis]|uniref:BHLH domain-containing protein n=1 Tax=Asparagus officinalis TaxID=4686 RepID=A0A5P1EUS4_ASPOF|nr:transcription factor bHLH35-like [Asparagus officinalis]ONK69544.1 uncharacterized protein A4U43_C05F24090 [Asparagus officinalis]